MATALALPVSLSDGTVFPYRDLIIFLALAVIFFTLVVQGLTLPWLLKKLSLSYNPAQIFEDWEARKKAAEAAMACLERLAQSNGLHAPALERVQSHYRDRLESLGEGPNTQLKDVEIPSASSHPVLQAENRIWQEVIDTERRTVIELRKKFAISDD